jgi:hypothetical protein
VVNGDPYNRSTGDPNMGYVNLVPGCNPINANWKSSLNYLNTNCFAAPTAPQSMASQCDPVSYGVTIANVTSGPVPCQNLIGNLHRNQLVGPGLFDMDFSVFKNVKINERFSTQFRVEMFNVLNHPAFLPPLNHEVVLNTTGVVTPGAGIIDTTADDPRQIQFGLKLNF